MIHHLNGTITSWECLLFAEHFIDASALLIGALICVAMLIDVIDRMR